MNFHFMHDTCKGMQFHLEWAVQPVPRHENHVDAGPPPS